MSQSDYIQYKKTGVQLRDLSSLPSVITPQIYTAFTEYNLENTVPNTKVTYNQLIPANRQIVYGSEVKVTNCPTFLLCSGTQARANRKPNLVSQRSPTPAPKYVKDPINYRYKYRLVCKCKNVQCVCTPVCYTCFKTPIAAPKACPL